MDVGISTHKLTDVYRLSSILAANPLLYYADVYIQQLPLSGTLRAGHFTARPDVQSTALYGTIRSRTNVYAMALDLKCRRYSAYRFRTFRTIAAFRARHQTANFEKDVHDKIWHC